MNKHGYGQDDIKIMESGFKIQWIDDDPSLPEGEDYSLLDYILPPY